MIDVYSLPEQWRKSKNRWNLNRSIVSLASYRTFSSSGVRFINYRRESKAIKSLTVFLVRSKNLRMNTGLSVMILREREECMCSNVQRERERDTLALRMSGSQDRYFANLNNSRPTKLSREVDIFKFITELLPLNTAWYVPRPVLWLFVLFFFFFFPRFARINPFKK